MARVLRSLPSLASSKRYYSFFSSKPGGGRNFNSPKPPKPIVASSSSSPSTTNSNNTAPCIASETKDGSKADELSTTALPVSECRDDMDSSNQNVQLPDLTPSPLHPSLKPHELVLHKFFSLHRPYLLINQPSSILFESAPPSLPTASTSRAFPPLGTIDNPPEASPEADADAARQLGRALVLNRVGNIVDWNQALSRLQINDNALPLPPTGVTLDSTKRKRRKKMKQHKLKKRRRLQRSLKLRLGK